MNITLLKKQFICTMLLSLLTINGIIAQENVNTINNQYDSLTTTVKKLEADLSFLRKIKISGLIHAQYQHAEAKGINSFAGGNFATDVNNRFMIRRGRIKVAYEGELSKVVLQMDATEKGVSLKDAYLQLTEPWMKTFSLTGGVFDRPFGYEISYSSSLRESPERSRIFQTLFPGERDLGAKLTIVPYNTPLDFITLDAGLFNGNGINTETDSYKDFIGHLYARRSLNNNKLHWGVGVSYYYGGYASAKDSVYAISKINGIHVFTPENTTEGDRVKREYYGIDAQIGWQWVIGQTKLMTEFITGTQPSLYTKTFSPSSGNAITDYTYSRKFNGYYIYLVQDVWKTPLQVVLKYDVYDPNTDVKGNDIGKTVADSQSTNAADVKYSTIGVGLNYQWNKNIRFMAYYDMVKNETSSSLTGYEKDIKDNVFTLRIQYKF